MKKIMIMAAALFACVSMSAQMKGDKTIYGNLGFSGGGGSTTVTGGSTTVTEKDKDPFNFNIGVGFGYFIADKLELGIALDYGLKKTENEWTTDDKKFYNLENAFTITPSLKYYAPIVDETFFYTPGVNFGLGFNSGKEQQNENTTVKMDDKPFVFSLGVDLLAFEFKPSYNIGINVSLGGIYFANASINYEEQSGDTTLKYKFSGNSWKIGFDTVFAPTIGFKYYFF